MPPCGEGSSSASSLGMDVGAASVPQELVLLALPVTDLQSWAKLLVDSIQVSPGACWC